MKKTRKVLFAFISLTLLILLFVGMNWWKFVEIWSPENQLEFPISKVKIPEPLFTKNFGSKIWLQKVNTVERFKEKTQNYFGAEVDVLFDPEKNFFDVHHNTDESTGLNLENILKSATVMKKFVWLDFKNLTDDNVSQALTELNRLVEDFNWKDKIIVESPNAKALTLFTDSGYYTSYYIPMITSRWAKLYGMNENERLSFIEKTLAQTKGTRFIAVSSDYRLYELVKFYFPKHDRLHWLPVKLAFLHSILSGRLLSDPGVKVVLRYE